MWLGAALLAAGWPAGSALSDALPLETAVKAAFLPKFGAFVDWPAERLGPAGEPARLCIAGDDPFGAALDQLVRGQQIGGRPIVVVRAPGFGGDAACQILFAAGSPGQPPAAELAKVRGQPVLTVTDGVTSPADRGIINFVVRDGRVRFQIDDRAATQAGLAISSKLLGLAVKTGAES
jgi:hypothetical protein